jgi:superfamily II RNA helicase
MSGRAGRRGLDNSGHVILLPQIFKAEMERADLKDLMMGKPQVLKSKFSVDANLVLESIKNKNFDKLEDFVKKTLLSTEIEKEKNGLNHSITDIENKLKVIKVENKEIFEEHVNIKKQLYSEIQPSNNQKKKLIAKLKDIESSDEYKKNINNYKTYETYKNNLDKYLKEKENLESFLGMDINDKIKFLTDKGYFQEKELTLKGKVGLIFRELDNIIGSEIVFNEFIDQFDDKKFLT